MIVHYITYKKLTIQKIRKTVKKKGIKEMECETLMKLQNLHIGLYEYILVHIYQ